jgi:hypothetical protein
MNRIRRSLALGGGAVLLGPSLAPPARASTAPRPVLEVSAEARLLGQGVLRFFGLRVYEARLWALAGSPSELFERDLFLELQYALSLNGTRIADRSVDEMKHIGRGSDAQRARWGERMRALFPDVVAGDRLLGHCLPRGPSRFFHNDRPLGIVDDPEFGPAFFGIWLDPRTSEPAMRAELLKGLGR